MENQIFKKLGLDDKEIEVYLALLKLGKTTAEKIKKETKIERTHIYKILERLADKNLITTIIENKTKHFIANSPKDLLLELKKTEKELSTLLPKLESLSQQVKYEETEVKIYRGKEGLEKLGEEFIQDLHDYIVFGEQGILQKLLPIYFEQFLKKIEEKKIKERVLVKEGIKTIKTRYSEIKYLPKEFDFPTSIIVSNNSTIIAIWSEPLLISICNKEVADSYKNYFEILWKIAKS
jgi:sugar-specific transcriptional regulator TrmB